MSQHGAPTPDPRIEQLYADCLDIYERSREVIIEKSNGTTQKYAPTRFKQQIDRAYAGDALVPAVTRVVRDTTKGFGHLAQAGREDLMSSRSWLMSRARITSSSRRRPSRLRGSASRSTGRSRRVSRLPADRLRRRGQPPAPPPPSAR